MPPIPVQAILGPLWDGSWTPLMVLSMSPKERNTCCVVFCHPRSCCSSGAWMLPPPPHPTPQGTAAFMPLWVLLSQRAVITTMWTHGHVNQRAPQWAKPNASVSHFLLRVLGGLWSHPGSRQRIEPWADPTAGELGLRPWDSASGPQRATRTSGAMDAQATWLPSVSLEGLRFPAFVIPAAAAAPERCCSRPVPS